MACALWLSGLAEPQTGMGRTLKTSLRTLGAGITFMSTLGNIGSPAIRMTWFRWGHLGLTPLLRTGQIKP
jgi:hypothetical protein